MRIGGRCLRDRIVRVGERYSCKLGVRDAHVNGGWRDTA